MWCVNRQFPGKLMLSSNSLIKYINEYILDHNFVFTCSWSDILCLLNHCVHPVFTRPWHSVCYRRNVSYETPRTPEILQVMVFNATFNNISAKLWQSIQLVEETGELWENHRMPQVSHKLLSHDVVSSTPHLSSIRTRNANGDKTKKKYMCVYCHMSKKSRVGRLGLIFF